MTTLCSTAAAVGTAAAATADIDLTKTAATMATTAAIDTASTTTIARGGRGNFRATISTTFCSFPYPLSHRRKSIIIQLKLTNSTTTTATTAAATAMAIAGCG